MSSTSNFANGFHRGDEDATSIGAGGTTVFGDSAPPLKEFELGLGSSSGKGKANIAHGIPLEVSPGKTVKFGQSQDDYSPKNSSLFVRIGDDGLVPALHKLNTRLKNVSCTIINDPTEAQIILTICSGSRRSTI